MLLLGSRLFGKAIQRNFGHDLVLHFGGCAVVERPALLPFAATRCPGFAHGRHFHLLDLRVDARKNALGIAHNRNLGVANLAYFGRVDVYVNGLSMRGEFRKFARHAVGETRAHANEQVAFGHGHIGVLGAVHAHRP